MTNFGLGISGVKDIAAAKEDGRPALVSKIVAVLYRLIWFTGLLGALVTFIGAHWLSEMAFGDDSYALGFVWLSITVLLKQLASAEFVILQGLRKLKDLAMANVMGSA